MQLPGIERLVRGGSNRPCLALAIFAPLQVKRAGGPAARLAIDDDELRPGPPVDLGDREKLPFPVVWEILFEVSLSAGFTVHVY